MSSGENSLEEKQLIPMFCDVTTFVKMELRKNREFKNSLQTRRNRS